MDGWEDQIDVDDSDLRPVLPSPLLPSSSLPHAFPRFLHPCSQISCSSQILDINPSLPLQSQLPIHISRNQNEEEHLSKLSTRRPLIPGPAGAIQAAMRRHAAAAAEQRPIFEEGGRDDRDLSVTEEEEDFKLNPWLYALSFLGRGTDSSLPCPICSINTQRSATKRIPQVVGIVKTCSPNGLGDLLITLKDPTGTINAAIHRKVLSEGNIGEISVGCVIILKQVVAFCPAYSSCYLNITLKNVVKLIAKDCGPPGKQLKPPFTFANAAELHGKQLQTELPTGESLFNSKKTAELTADVEPNRNFASETMKDSSDRSNGFLPENLSGNISADAASTKPITRIDEPGRLISRASVAEWTDEQLEKLFSDYEDDAVLVRPAI